MRPRRVLITGASRYLGGRLARLLADEPGIESIIAVDAVTPQHSVGRADFVRADIRNPLIAKVIAAREIDTVVHMNVLATPLGAGGRSAMKEINVIGTMQLLAACQKAPSVRKFVLKSTAAVYGSSPRDPALFTEDLEPRGVPSGGYTKDAVEVEGYVRGFGRRRPDVTLTLLRFANFIGPNVETPLTRYFSLPLVPTVLGFDPRIQFCHEDDGLAVLHRAVVEEHPGTFNVGGRGVLALSQAIRRAGRPTVAIPATAVNLAGLLARRFGLVDFSPEQMRLLEHGRATDTTRLRTVFGYRPRFDTAAAFADFVAAHAGPVRPERVAALEQALAAAVSLVGAGRVAGDG